MSRHAPRRLPDRTSDMIDQASAKGANPDASDNVLKHKPFARFWLARIFSSISFQILSVVIGWQIYALTGSALALGLVGLAQFVPMVLLTLIVGHVADRYDRRVICCLCEIVEAVAAGILLFGTVQGFVTDRLIYAIAALIGAARAFENPSMQALAPGLVPRRLVPRAMAWSASAMQTAQIVGPALGGLIYAIGAGVAYVTAIVLLCIAAVLMNMIALTARSEARPPPTFASIFSGIFYIRHHRVILGLTSLDLFAVMFGGATALMPIFARDILMTGAWGLGLLRAAPAVGALVMSAYLAFHPMQPPIGRRLFIAIATFGVATCIFGVSRNLFLSLAALAVLGAADVISVVIRQTLVQLETPDEMRGRVTAVNALFIGASNQLGEFESGVTAALFGTVPAVLLGGLATLAVALTWMRLFPELPRLDDIKAYAERKA